MKLYPHFHPGFEMPKTTGPHPCAEMMRDFHLYQKAGA
jgi:hypothetical protein